jgi:hypothetical protein
MKKLVAAALGLAFMATSGPALAQEMTGLGCQEEFEQVLARHGIKLTDLQDFHHYKVGRHSPSVVIEGRPPQCQDGSLNVSMWYTCTLQSMYTTGDCRVPGVSTSPLPF